MATENHHQGSTNCLDDPNFATICSFLEKFGELCHVSMMPFAELQEMLENTNEVPLPLVQLHIRLLRRVFKSINTSKWEKSVSKFAHMFNSQDGWEIERFGYKKSKIQTKLRILKNLLESQFDYNPKFKGEVNKLLAADLRMVPIGRDQEGNAYWYQVDPEANLRVYREDIDEETWEIVASSKEGLEQLIVQLKNGDISTKAPEDVVVEEDTNGVEMEPKEILLDSGKQLMEATNNGTEDYFDDESMDVGEGFDDNSLGGDEDDIDMKPDVASEQTLAVNGHKDVIGSVETPISASARLRCVDSNEVSQGATRGNSSHSLPSSVAMEISQDLIKKSDLPRQECVKNERDLEKTTAVDDSPYFETRSIKEESPATKEESPATQKETPATKEESPATKEEKPATKEETPAIKEEGGNTKEEFKTIIPSGTDNTATCKLAASTPKVIPSETISPYFPTTTATTTATTTEREHKKVEETIAYKSDSQSEKVTQPENIQTSLKAPLSQEVNKPDLSTTDDFLPVKAQTPSLPQSTEGSEISKPNISKETAVKCETPVLNVTPIAENIERPTKKIQSTMPKEYPTETSSEGKSESGENVVDSNSSALRAESTTQGMKQSEIYTDSSLQPLADVNEPAHRDIQGVKQVAGLPDVASTALELEKPVAPMELAVPEDKTEPPSVIEKEQSLEVVSLKEDANCSSAVGQAQVSQKLGSQGGESEENVSSNVKESSKSESVDLKPRDPVIESKIEDSVTSASVSVPVENPAPMETEEQTDAEPKIALPPESAIISSNNDSSHRCRSINESDIKEPEFSPLDVNVPQPELTETQSKLPQGSLEKRDAVTSSEVPQEEQAQDSVGKRENADKKSSLPQTGNKDTRADEITLDSSVEQSFEEDYPSQKTYVQPEVPGDEKSEVGTDNSVMDTSSSETLMTTHAPEKSDDDSEIKTGSLTSQPSALLENKETASILVPPASIPTQAGSTSVEPMEIDEEITAKPTQGVSTDVKSAETSATEMKLESVATDNSSTSQPEAKESSTQAASSCDNMEQFALSDLAPETTHVISKTEESKSIDISTEVAVSSEPKKIATAIFQVAPAPKSDLATKDIVVENVKSEDSPSTQEILEEASEPVDESPASAQLDKLTEESTIVTEPAIISEEASQPMEQSATKPEPVVAAEEVPIGSQESAIVTAPMVATVEAPKPAEEAPKRLEEPAKSPQEAPKPPEEASCFSPDEAPKPPEEAPKPPKEAPITFKETPKLPEEAPKLAEESSKLPEEALEPSKEAPKIPEEALEPLKEPAIVTVPASDSAQDPMKPAEESVTPPEATATKPADSSVAVAEDKIAQPVVKETEKKSRSPKPGLLGLVAYGSSSDDDGDDAEEETEEAKPESEKIKAVADTSSINGMKRKPEDDPCDEEQPAKFAKVDPIVNPIVGEAIEESVMIITGSGEGALNEGGNESPSGSPAPGAASEDDDDDDDDDDEGYLPSKQKARGRPRGKAANKKEVLKDKNVTDKKTPEPKGGRRNSLNSDDVNGSSGPVRRSGRVAQIRQKEEEERRRLEEERLAQLKEAQVRKQQKMLEKELKAAAQGDKPPKAKAPRAPKGSKAVKSNKQQEHVTYLPSSESASESEADEDFDEEEYGGGRAAKGGKKKRKKRGKNGKALKKGVSPWMQSSSEEDEAVEEEEDEHVEEEEEELHFNTSDHEFSPESDVGEDSEYSPTRHARTAKRKEEAVEEDKYAETYCDKCGKGDHPEWILLCDSCDKGWHGLCVNPQIWVIPEGEWFCPPCQHNMLVNKLSENLVEYDKILKKRENEVLRKQRLAYVGISLNNVLPSAEKPEKAEEEANGENDEEEEEYRVRKSKHRRRRLYSDPEDMGNFINDGSDDSNGGESGSGSYVSQEEPIYQLRQRRATKGFSFQEYDDMIKSALRDSDAEDVENQKPEETHESTNNGILSEPTTDATTTTTTTINADTVKELEAGKPLEEAKGGEDSEDEENIGKKKKVARIQDEETDDEELDEKERNRRKVLNSNQKKSRRRLNDLDATSEEDSDEDFKGSGMEDDEDEEEGVMEEDSDWSGDGDESDDSIALARAKKKKHHGPLGRQVRYSDEGTVRRSTRRRKSRVTYDESDQDEDEEDQNEKWQSGESDESESDSESDDETWGKKKKKKGFAAAPKSKVPNFFLNANMSPKKAKAKKKKRKADDEEVDRAWSNKVGSKAKKLAEEPVERKTRGRKINFKDILDSGESDDDGNIRPKRRRILSDSDDDEEPGSSRRLVEEIRAANVRAMAEEKLRAEEKMKEMANAEKQQQQQQMKKEAVQQIPSSALPLPTPAPLLQTLAAPILIPATIATAAIPLPSELNPLLIGSLEGKKSVKITNSIVESLLRKSPSLPESPPATSSPSIPSMPVGPGLTDPTGILPTLRGLAQPSFLPSVIPPPPLATSGVTSVTGSARVGKKKTASMLPIPASSAGDVLPFPSSAKKTNSVVSLPVPSKAPPGLGVPPSSSPNSNIPTSLPTGLPPNISSDLARLAGPIYGNNPALRPFHPAWARNPPPYAGPPGQNLGKPPPLSGSGFIGQPGQLRGHLPPGGYPQPPPGLRIPSPSTIPAFQQFGKRTGDVGSPPYRLPPASQQIPGNVLSSMARDRERVFIGGSSPYGPFGMLPPQAQGQQHPGLFANPFEPYRAPESFKDELLERNPGQALPPTSGPPGGAGSQAVPPSSGVSTGAPQTTPTASAPIMAVAATVAAGAGGGGSGGHKEEGGSQGDGEFGGLVSYFSSQHSNDED